MKIKIYVDYDNRKVMTEEQMEGFVNTTVEENMRNSLAIRNMLDFLNVYAEDLFLMDTKEREKLESEMREHFRENAYEFGDFEMTEFEF